MTRTLIFHSDRFDVVSYGNGLNYAVQELSSGRELFVQGDDAAIFRQELEAFETSCPEAPYDSFYAEQLSLYERSTPEWS